jgi:DNA-binding GntR family transcriptional regulator
MQSSGEECSATSAEQAARSMRESILSGRLPAGARIAAEDIARQLSVSRTPVREALSRLAAEGLVELSPNRGARVASWTTEELREIFDLRLRLEPYAVRQAILRLAPAQLNELDELARVMQRAARPGPGQDLEIIVRHNRRFHGLLIDLAGNTPLATALTAATHMPVVRPNFRHYSPAALARSMSHHVEIVEAARSGDPAWAESVMRCHLHSARAAMLSAPAGWRGDGPDEPDGAGPDAARPGRGGQR